MSRKHLTLGVLLALGLISCQGPTPPISGETTPTAHQERSSPKSIPSDQFVSAERPTSGTVKLTESNNGYMITLGADFQTANGPDLQVVLHRSNDPLSELSPPTYPLQATDFIVISPLKSIKGRQTYPIPKDLKPEDYGSVAIWCQKFNATFGVASLSPS